ncbi:nucleotidyltransferase substrate binding protein [Cyclobacterium sp. 1_MG-2023]|uniref:nucleotidyltransferase substrate binding protein n=1 Tax=Cyclobacterium sp. 1_MG-2023 TaxID=3062681 RepID=UPI0026E2F703|nr:nucleotidyltransferase substrate binding protein [Cyclobacterium sp. 1_MG-2023]MDO6437216.1 nucleotidyltransferase substrate binding protein [Cyclobacterium sp. 1_MG-2023]
MRKPVLDCENCFAEFTNQLNELQDLILEGKSHGMNDEVRSKLIVSFEKTHDAALETIAAYFRNQGKTPFSGSRDITVEAFHADLIDDGQGWLDMIIHRIKYNPLYPGDYLGSLSENIVKNYLGFLESFERNMSKKLDT